MEENDEQNWSVRKIVSSMGAQVNPETSSNPRHSGTSETVQDGIKCVSTFLDQIKEQPPAAQVGAGAVCGFINGYIFKKMARVTLIGVGGGLLVLAVAQNQGYLKVNGSNLKSDMSAWMNKVQTKFHSLMQRETLSDESVIVFYERFSPLVFSFVTRHCLFLSGTSGGFLLSLAF